MNKTTNEDLAVKASQGDTQAYEDLYRQNEKLIWFVVHKFKNSDVEAEDLFGIATLGFVRAVNKFDASKGLKFSSYVIAVIYNQIRIYLRDNRRRFIKKVSLDEVWRANASGDEISLIDITPSDSESILEKLIGEEEISDLRNLIKELKPKQQVITNSYLKGKTQLEIAKEIGITQSQISRKLKAVIEELKKGMRERG